MVVGKLVVVDMVWLLFEVMGVRIWFMGEVFECVNVVKIVGNFMLVVVIESMVEVSVFICVYGVGVVEFFELMISMLFVVLVY